MADVDKKRYAVEEATFAAIASGKWVRIPVPELLFGCPNLTCVSVLVKYFQDRGSFSNKLLVLVSIFLLVLLHLALLGVLIT